MDKLYADSETGCCPRFNPEPWDQKEVTWQDKLFLKDRVKSFCHIPLNFGKVMVRDMEAITKADALAPEPLLLSDENSLRNIRQRPKTSNAQPSISPRKPMCLTNATSSWAGVRLRARTRSATQRPPSSSARHATTTHWQFRKSKRLWPKSNKAKLTEALARSSSAMRMRTGGIMMNDRLPISQDVRTGHNQEIAADRKDV